MPALTIFKTFTTKPFSPDDFQIICIILSTYRIVQLCCLLPLLIRWLIQRLNGNDLVINDYSNWCPQWNESFEDRGDFLVLTVDEYEEGYDVTRRSFSLVFIVLAAVFSGLDFAWIVCVWGAATMGTPTQPRGRDEYLRYLIIGKMLVINIFLIALVTLGCVKIAELRRDNYGCGDRTPDYYPDASWDYTLYCVLIVTYFLEIAVWPTIFVNKVTRWIRSNKVTRRRRYGVKAKGERLEQCLGGVLRCLSLICCGKSGGKEIKNQGELTDFASNLMEFANNETRVGIVLSDMYVGGKMLARVQAERRMKTIQMLQRTSNGKEEEEPSSSSPTTTTTIINRRNLLDSENVHNVRHRKSILTIQTDRDDGTQCIVVEKNVLTSDNPSDVEALRNAAHYSIYAQYIYFHIRWIVREFIGAKEENEDDNDSDSDSDSTTASATSMMFIRDFDRDGIRNQHQQQQDRRQQQQQDRQRLSLAKYEDPEKHLFYANFQNGLAATPYAILVDEDEKSVVIAVRGTLSLEDWVIDLQYVPQPLDKVGELCGFDGKGHHCHKGVLTRCKWMYNDIKKRRVLKNLYSSGSSYEEYDLVVVGHSLGGGCAQVLSLMLRPSFPSLRCYAFEPPGCIFDDVLSEDCNEWITSIVRHEDLVPRVTQPNLESLRDEFFDVVARIKVPKIKAFHDVRSPCPESNLGTRNAAILCPKGEIDRDTVFYQKIQKFRNERAAKNLTGDVSVKLYIPGQIIHLVDTLGDETKYVPYWASRYEFNQVILSKRMLPDHSMPPLVGILQKLNLDDVHEVRTWHVDNKDAEDEDVEVFIFIPFSNPQGKIPLGLILFAIVATILSISSGQGCQYVSRSTVLSYTDGISNPGNGLSAGLWSYNLKRCIDAESCNTTDPIDLEDSSYCQAYGRLFNTIDVHWTFARVAGTISVLLGCISIGIISTATCTKFRKRTWLVLVTLLLLATLCQGLQFLFLKSDLCNEWTNPETSEVVTSECSLSIGGNCAIAATIFWFAIAVGCSHMARTATH